MLEIAGAVLLIVVLLAGWLLTVLNLPGNWLMVAATALYAFLMPPESRLDISWATVAVLIGLAVAGEIVETAAGAVGASRQGGSRRGMLLAVAGSIAGSVLGAAIGLPIPIVGPIVGAVLFASLGAMFGAVLGEQWVGRDAETTWRVGQAAFWGRLFGTLGKIIIGSAMVAIATLAIFLT